MFTVRLRLISEDMSGLVALDRARVLGLHDTSSLHFTSGGHVAGARCAEAEVGESFARVFFGPQQTLAERAIPQDMCCASDLQSCGGHNANYVTFRELPPERVKELFMAAWHVELLDRCKAIEARLAAQED